MVVGDEKLANWPGQEKRVIVLCSVGCCGRHTTKKVRFNHGRAGCAAPLSSCWLLMLGLEVNILGGGHATATTTPVPGRMAGRAKTEEKRQRTADETGRIASKTAQQEPGWTTSHGANAEIIAWATSRRHTPLFRFGSPVAAGRPLFARGSRCPSCLSPTPTCRRGLTGNNPEASWTAQKRIVKEVDRKRPMLREV